MKMKSVRLPSAIIFFLNTIFTGTGEGTSPPLDLLLNLGMKLLHAVHYFRLQGTFSFREDNRGSYPCQLTIAWPRCVTFVTEAIDFIPLIVIEWYTFKWDLDVHKNIIVNATSKKLLCRQTLIDFWHGNYTLKKVRGRIWINRCSPKRIRQSNAFCGGFYFNQRFQNALGTIIFYGVNFIENTLYRVTNQLPFW